MVLRRLVGEEKVLSREKSSRGKKPLDGKGPPEEKSEEHVEEEAVRRSYGQARDLKQALIGRQPDILFIYFPS